jgi:peptide/nickel transport system permease protein
MITYILQRLAVGLLVALAVSIITFSLTNLAVDPAVVLAGATASHQDIEAIRSLYGFDQHIVIRYLNWLSAALRGDLGISFRTHLPVFDLIMDRLPVTLILGVSSLILAIVVALPLAILAALNPNTWIDRACLTLAVFGQALPTFWFGLLMIVLFSVNLGWLPASGSGSWEHYVMPSIALGYYAMPALMRLTRTGLLDVLSADYIRTARAKGLMPVTVIFKHALRNAILPIISLAAVQFGMMLGGSIVIESVFALPGVGLLAWESITQADYPVMQAIVLIVSVLYVIFVLIADFINAALDPRIRMA